MYLNLGSYYEINVQYYVAHSPRHKKLYVDVSLIQQVQLNGDYSPHQF
ncbi:hypothetical protein [Vibrio parahaemolyticus]|nr:hypothetical protein [Vibrio parahaemolyticus]